MLYHVIPCYTVLYCVILCYTVLYCVVQVNIQSFTSYISSNVWLMNTHAPASTVVYCVILGWPARIQCFTSCCQVTHTFSQLCKITTDWWYTRRLVDHQMQTHQQRPRKRTLSWRKTRGSVGYHVTRGRGFRQSPQVATCFWPLSYYNTYRLSPLEGQLCGILAGKVVYRSVAWALWVLRLLQAYIQCTMIYHNMCNTYPTHAQW